MIKNKNKIYKFEYKMLNLQLFSFVLLALCLVIMLLFYNVGIISNDVFVKLADSVGNGQTIDVFVIFVLMWIWMFLHELIHGCMYVIGGADYKNIKYGIVLEKGILYCKCGQYVSKNAILLSIISPFVLIGVVTLIIGFMITSPVLILLSIINIMGACADVLLFFSFFLFRNKDLEFKEIKDSSTFLVKTSEDLTKKKFISVKLVEVLDEDYVEEEDKLITVTKVSKVCIVIMLVILVIEFILNLNL